MENSINTLSLSESKKTKKYDLAIVIGRFQPLHLGHEHLLLEATKLAPKVLVLVGSSQIARNIRNPFTFNERSEMIRNFFDVRDFDYESYNVEPLVDDLYSDQAWTAQVHSAIENCLWYFSDSLDPAPNVDDLKICIVGYHKDDTSYYLDIFPKFKVEEINPFLIDGKQIDATSIRDELFGGFSSVENFKAVECSNVVNDYLQNWSLANNDEYSNLYEENMFITNYKQQFANMPYPPTFVTTDAVVINNGYVLLVRRRSHPGKGLWAIPGGFINVNERIEDCMIRELAEETKINVSKDILRSSLKYKHVFDAPGRSLRGRTITHAGLFVLNSKQLPRVKGSDDAEKAKWFSIREIYNMSHLMYEDHYSIVTYMINRV